MKKYFKILIFCFALIFLASCSEDKLADKKSDSDVSEQKGMEDKKEIDVTKYLDDLYINEDKRQYYMKFRTENKTLNHDQHNNYSSVAEISFDGKVYKNESFQSDNGIETFYIDVVDGMETVYHSVVYPSGELKEKYPPETNEKNGVMVDTYSYVWDSEWKLEEQLSKGDLLVYYDEIKDNDLNILSPDESITMSDTKGTAKKIATFSKKTGDLVKFELYIDYKTNFEREQDSTSMYKSGITETSFSEILEPIEFRKVDKIQIPQDLLDAKTAS